MTPADVREAAALYIHRGLRPIPMWGVDDAGRCLCGSRECNAGKHARDDREPWKDGRAYIPLDFSTHDNIAIALGPWREREWLVCLDVDGPDSLLTLVGPTPATLEQKSPRGRHHFFTVRPYEALGNWVDCLSTKYSSGTGLDIRYARGKINVAPSRSAFGAYEWQGWREPAPLPGSVLSRILDARRRKGLPVQRHWERKGKRA